MLDAYRSLGMEEWVRRVSLCPLYSIAGSSGTRVLFHDVDFESRALPRTRADLAMLIIANLEQVPQVPHTALSAERHTPIPKSWRALGGIESRKVSRAAAGLGRYGSRMERLDRFRRNIQLIGRHAGSNVAQR